MDKLLSCFIILLIFGIRAVFLFEINWVWYDSCEILVVHSQTALFQQVTSNIIPHMSTHKPTDKVITWKITTGTPLKSYPIYFNWKEPKVYIATKGVRQLTRRSCSLILIPMDLVNAEFPYRDTRYFANAWRHWLKKGTTLYPGQISLHPNTIIAIIDEYVHNRSIPSSNSYNTLFNPPVLSFIMRVKKYNDGWRVVFINMICSGSCYEMRWFYKRIRLFKVSIRVILGFQDAKYPPSIKAVLYPISTLGIGATFHCPQNFPSHKLYQQAWTLDCVRSEAMVLTELAKYLNSTVEFGSQSETVKHHMAVITLSEIFPQILWNNNVQMTNFIFDDSVAVRIFYCEQVAKYQVSSSIDIVKSTFDLPTWISLFIILLYCVWFIKHETIKISAVRNRAKSLFEIVSLMFQGSMWKTDTFRITLTFSYLLLQFMFLSRATELIISPPTQLVAETTSSLINDGYRFTYRIFLWKESQAEINRIVFEHAEIINQSLESEGFKGNIFNLTYWTPPFFAERHEYTEIVKNAYKNIFANAKVMLMVSASSLNNFDILWPKDDVTYEVQKEGRVQCHAVKSIYRRNVRFYYIYSVIRARLERVLKTIVYDAGIRLYWLSRMKFATRIYNEETKKIDAQKMRLSDPRTQVMFELVTAGLTVSVCIFLIERHKLISVWVVCTLKIFILEVIHFVNLIHRQCLRHRLLKQRKFYILNNSNS